MGPYQQQPQYPQQPQNSNPYEFIMNPGQPNKPKRLGVGGNAGMLLAVVVGGAIILMVILAIIVNLAGSGKANTDDLVSLAQTQNELIRVSNRGVREGVQQTTKNLAVTAEYAIRTQQQQTIGLLTKNGRTLGDKELTLKQNAQTDQQFTTAKATSTFDLVFSQVMQNELTAYATNLKNLFNKTSGTQERERLSAYYEQAQLLISQIPYTQESIKNIGQ